MFKSDDQLLFKKNILENSLITLKKTFPPSTSLIDHINLCPIPIPSRPRPLQSAPRRERYDTMPPTFFSKNVDLKLIDLVKENPVLYNPRHPKYTDSDTREVTWQKIGDSLSRPGKLFLFFYVLCQSSYYDLCVKLHVIVCFSTARTDISKNSVFYRLPTTRK